MLKHCNIQKTEVAIKMYFCKTVVLSIYCESKEVTWNFRKMLEKIFWASSLLIQLLFRYFLQGFYLDSKLLLLLHFRFPRACIFQNIFFSHPFMVTGLGITRQLTRWETVVLLILFTFLGYLRLPESSIEIWSIMLIGKNKVPDPTFCGRSVPGLVP